MTAQIIDFQAEKEKRRPKKGGYDYPWWDNDAFWDGIQPELDRMNGLIDELVGTPYEPDDYDGT